MASRTMPSGRNERSVCNGWAKGWTVREYTETDRRYLTGAATAIAAAAKVAPDSPDVKKAQNDSQAENACAGRRAGDEEASGPA